MPPMSRAGLVSLVVFFLSIGLAATAPVSDRISIFAARYDNHDTVFVARSLRDREFDITRPDYITRQYLSLFDEREFDKGYDEFTEPDHDFSMLDDLDLDELEYITRDDSDLHMLYRRKSIKPGFEKFGSKVDAGFQKAGRKIKAGFQKATRVLKKGSQNPGIEQPLKVVSKVIGALSDPIHAEIDGKLEKGPKIMINLS